MTINDNNFHPSATSIVTVDNDRNEYYPSASIVPLDDNTPPQQHQQQYTDHQLIPYTDNTNHNNNDYASAQVVGGEISPFSHQVAVATDTTATAVALDPWSKTPTTTTDLVPANNDNATRPPVVVQPTNNVIFLEDPRHKKIRRRRRRRARMAISGMGGFVVGSFVLGPIGAIVGAASGAAIARAASKSGERRKDRRVERQLFNVQQEHFHPQEQEQRRFQRHHH